MKKRELIIQRQVKYVEDIVVTIKTAKIGMSRKRGDTGHIRHRKV